MGIGREGDASGNAERGKTTQLSKPGDPRVQKKKGKRSAFLIGGSSCEWVRVKTQRKKESVKEDQLYKQSLGKKKKLLKRTLGPEKGNHALPGRKTDKGDDLIQLCREKKRQRFQNVGSEGERRQSS